MAEDRDRRRVEREQPALRRQTEPAGSEHAQRGPCAKRATSPSTARTSAMTASTRRPTSAAFSPSGTPSRQSDHPHLGPDLRCRPPLVGAVVPLHELLPEGGDVAQTGEAARFGRAAAGSSARARTGGRATFHRRARFDACPPPSRGCRCGRCASAPAPERLAVTHEDDLGPHQRARRRPDPQAAGLSRVVERLVSPEHRHDAVRLQDRTVDFTEIIEALTARSHGLGKRDARAAGATPPVCLLDQTEGLPSNRRETNEG